MLVMFRILLASCLLLFVNAQTTNLAYSSEIQKQLSLLQEAVQDVEDEISPYFARIGNPIEYHENNYDKLEKNVRLLGVLKENITSSLTIVNYTLLFQASDAELSLQSERQRAGAIEEALARLAVRAHAAGGALSGARGRLAAARDQQRPADETMNELQVRLLGLRRALDALINREGQLEFRLGELLTSLRAYKTRAEAVFEGKNEAQKSAEDVKRKTNEIENAINQARSEIQALKMRSLEAPSVPSTSTSTSTSTITTISGVNYIKSVKTASGKGKKIRLILLSD